MIKHYDYTYKDFLMLRATGKQKKTILAKHDFSHTTVFKKWGMEYLIYEDKDCCGWFLHITENLGTSLHCHETKTTVLCVVSGLIVLTTSKGKHMFQSGDIVYLDKKVFHAMGAATENTRVIELEMPSYKPDSIRSVDFWKREGKPYEEGCLLLELNPPLRKKGMKEKR